jgi:hypothetical protein
MPRVRTLRPLLLVLALLAGQWLTFTHGFQHSALMSDADCELCLQVRQLGAGAAPAVAGGPAVHFTIEAPADTTAVDFIAARPAPYRSRGPPTLLV